jgi:hypothetical protein
VTFEIRRKRGRGLGLDVLASVIYWNPFGLAQRCQCVETAEKIPDDLDPFEFNPASLRRQPEQMAAEAAASTIVIGE